MLIAILVLLCYDVILLIFKWRLKMIYNNINDLMIQIKHIMIDRDIRQSDISNNTGWSRQTVSNLLACRRDSINIDTLARLCDAIDCNLIIDIQPRSRQEIQETKEDFKSDQNKYNKYNQISDSIALTEQLIRDKYNTD